MLEDTNLQRCLKLVGLLDTEHGWGLTQQLQRHYAEQVVGCCANIAAMTDVQICAMLRYYHKDHALVEALRDSAHVDHADRWMEWIRQSLRILAAKGPGTLLANEA